MRILLLSIVCSFFLCVCERGNFTEQTRSIGSPIRYFKHVNFHKCPFTPYKEVNKTDKAEDDLAVYVAHYDDCGKLTMVTTIKAERGIAPVRELAAIAHLHDAEQREDIAAAQGAQSEIAAAGVQVAMLPDEETEHGGPAQ